MTSPLRVRSDLRKPLSARSPVTAPNSTSLHPVLRLQQTAGNRAVARLHAGGYLQAKLTIGAPEDIYEQEADRVAARVMRRIGPGFLTSEPAAVAGVPIQRQVEEEEEELLQARGRDPVPTLQRQEEEELEELLQARRASPVPAMQWQGFPEAEAALHLSPASEPAPTAASESSMPAAAGDVESRLAAGRGSGQALDLGFRAELEGAFGYDFGGVRIHTGAAADELSGQVRAEAFTNERDIYFRAGRYQPGTESGRFLLTHELTHVIQQGAAVPRAEIDGGE